MLYSAAKNMMNVFLNNYVPSLFTFNNQKIHSVKNKIHKASMKVF